MLVLTRQKNESIIIGQDIVVQVLEFRRDKVRLGVMAPDNLPVHRLEIWRAIRAEKTVPEQAALPIHPNVQRAIEAWERR